MLNLYVDDGVHLNVGTIIFFEKLFFVKRMVHLFNIYEYTNKYRSYRGIVTFRLYNIPSQ